ncbi:unnamed protein product [Boreogadus saida]
MHPHHQTRVDGHCIVETRHRHQAAASGLALALVVRPLHRDTAGAARLLDAAHCGPLLCVVRPFCIHDLSPPAESYRGENVEQGRETPGQVRY